jgi:signal transduction histidine kinase
MVEDNGKGFDMEQQQVKTTGTNKGSGLRNIKSRLQSINATINIDTAKPFGTTTTISIPYNI